MEKLHSFFPRNNTISESYFVKLIETLFKVRLSGLALYMCYAVGNGLIYSVPLAGIVFAGSYLINSNQPLDQRLSAIWLAFIMTFFVIFLSSFVSEIKPSLLAWFRARFKNYTIVTTSLLTVLGLATCIVLLIIYFSVFLLSEVTDKDESKQYENLSEITADSLYADVHELQGQPLPYELNKNATLNKELESLENMSLEELNQWLKDNGDENIDLEKRQKLIEQSLTEVSLLDDEVTDTNINNWDEFFLELELLVSTKPLFVSQGISKLIRGNPSFEILVEALNRGYSFNGNHISMLSGTLSVEELQTLVSYGVDLTAPSSGGSNALVGALFNVKNKDVFDYLLSFDDIVYSEEVNVLREVLDYSSMLRYDFSYAQKVLDRGVEVTEETAFWIENDLKRNDYDFYKKVKDKIDLN
jgi:hypothetical protein